jgi:hypothetical protein
MRHSYFPLSCQYFSAIACLLVFTCLISAETERSTGGVSGFGEELPPDLHYFRSTIDDHVLVTGKLPELGRGIARFDGKKWTSLYQGVLPENILALSDRLDDSAYVISAINGRPNIFLDRYDKDGVTELAEVLLNHSIREGLDDISGPENFVFCPEGDVWILSDARRVIHWQAKLQKAEEIDLIKTVPLLQDAGGATLPEGFALPMSGLQAGDGRLWLWTEHLNWRAPPGKRGIVLMREAEGTPLLPPDYIGLTDIMVSRIFPAADGGVWISSSGTEERIHGRLWRLPSGSSRLIEIKLPENHTVAALFDFGAKQLCALHASDGDNRIWYRDGDTWGKFEDVQSYDLPYPFPWVIQDGYAITGWKADEGLLGFSLKTSAKTEIRRWGREVGLELFSPAGVFPLAHDRFLFRASNARSVLFEAADLTRRPPATILATRNDRWVEGPLPDDIGGLWFALSGPNGISYEYHGPGAVQPLVWDDLALRDTNNPDGFTPMFDNRNRFWLLTGNQEDELLCFDSPGQVTRHRRAISAWPDLIAKGLRFRPARLVGNISTVPAVASDGQILALDRRDLRKRNRDPEIHLYDGKTWRSTPMEQITGPDYPEYATWSETGLARIGFGGDSGVELREQNWVPTSFAEPPPIACRTNAERYRDLPSSIADRLPNPVEGHARDETGVLWITAGERLWRSLGDHLVQVLPADQPLPSTARFLTIYQIPDGTRYFIPAPHDSPWRLAPLPASPHKLEAAQLRPPDRNAAVVIKTNLPQGGLLQWRHADGPWSEYDANAVVSLPELPAGLQPVTLRAWDPSLNFIGSVLLNIAAPDRGAGAKLRVDRLIKARGDERINAVQEIADWGETCRPLLHELQSTTAAEDELSSWIRIALQALDDRQMRATNAAAPITE